MPFFGKIKSAPYLPFIAALLCCDPAVAQNTTGKILSSREIVSGIAGTTGNAVFDIRAYNANTIRVRLSQQQPVSNFSYALADTSMPSFSDVRVENDPDKLILSTNRITAAIEKTPYFKVTFFDKKGAVINEDMSGEGFGTTFSGNKVTVYKKLQRGERFVGMGEALGNLDKRGMGITLWNTDNYRYGDPRIPMYLSVPFYIGIHDSLIYGIFYNNSNKSYFNFGNANVLFASAGFEGGNADYFFIYDTSIAKILEHYSALTGRMPLPPLWSLGYHQSRCSYYPQDKALWIAQTFRRKHIPLDCVVLDADYLQDYEPFRINTDRFPDMKGLADTLRNLNIELTASVNPGIKLDSSYEAYRDGLRKNVFLKYADGSLYTAPIDPSLDLFVDFTSAAARKWWGEKMKIYQQLGINGYWNDMNEPAVSGQYIPDNVVFDFDGRTAHTTEARNVYGMQMARSSFEAAQSNRKDKRPFVLTRSAFAGIQRYAAVWSGDNQAKDEYLLGGILLNTQLGLSGIPFTGDDIGGYIGDGNKELYERWIESGIFSPFVRNHREAYAASNEPWAYGEEAEGISRTYIGLRYRLLPYIYSTFYTATGTGMPVARSLCIAYPFDAKVYDNIYQYQFQFGDALMIVPVTTTEKIKRIYLPEGDWYDAYNDSLATGKKEFLQEVPVYKLPIFVKASSIIPLQSLVQSTKETPSDTLYLHVYHGKNRNTFTYYEDDGSSYSYRNGEYCRRTIRFEGPAKRIILDGQEGSYASHFAFIRVILHGFDKQLKGVTVNGRAYPLSDERWGLLDPLDNLGDVYDKDYYRSLRASAPAPQVKTFTIANSEGVINISW